MSHPMTLPSAPACAERWRRAFPGEPDQARAARRFAAALLAGCPELDDVLLTGDPLVGNARRHTKAAQPCGTLTVESAPWHVAVADDLTASGHTLPLLVTRA